MRTAGILVATVAVLVGFSPPALATEARGDACAILSSAFARGFETGGKMDGSWPRDVRPSRAEGPDAFRLRETLDAYLRDTSLTAAEVADLKRQAEKHVFAPYAPDCPTMGKPARVIEMGQAMTAEFTRPLLSSDGKVAIVLWSLQSRGRWGHGYFCEARKAGNRWRSVCRETWIG